ncbi:MAG: hypothetical protein FJ130_04125 [Deltaproteobacteria bacterium]|nr:hypothetical protein [Deltaproteobacteria bacterium]
MNIKRGIFRLAFVLSILAAIILPLCLLETHPWVTCRVMRYEYEKEDIDKAEKAIENLYPETKRRPGQLEIYQDDEQWMQSKIAKGKIYKLLKDKGQWHVYEFKWNGGTSYGKDGKISIMASRVDLVGICDEISSKGYIEGNWEGYPMKLGGVYPSDNKYIYSMENKFFDDPDNQKHLYLEDITTHINWNRFFLVMAISFTSIWFLYAFVRLVIIGFIAEGFKNKSSKGSGAEA